MRPVSVDESARYVSKAPVVASATQKKTALVVEDNEMVGVTLKRYLEIWGYEVTLVTRGVEAVKLLESKGPFTVVLTDYGLEDGNTGLDVVKAATAANNTPVVVVSATITPQNVEEDSDLVKEINSAGAMAIVCKPLTKDRMLALNTAVDKAESIQAQKAAATIADTPASQSFSHTAGEIMAALNQAAVDANSPAAIKLKKLYGENNFMYQLKRYQKLVRKFIEHYGEGARMEIMHGPARINIIGEHVDYVSYIPGMVLPFGSREYDMLMAVSPRNDSQVRLRSMQEGQGEGKFQINPGEFDMSEAPREGADKWKTYLDEKVGTPPFNWTNFVKGACFYLQNTRPESNLKGMNVLVDSDIPISGGVSSSSALVTLSGYAIRRVNGIETASAVLGDESSRAEWFVGTRGGAMDQTTIAAARADSALQIIFGAKQIKPIPIPKGYKWVTFYTGPHEGGGQITSEYNERSAISRFVIPQMLQDDRVWHKAEDPGLRVRWEKIVEAMQKGDLAYLRLTSTKQDIDYVLNLLDEKLTLGEIKNRYPEVYQKIENEKGPPGKPGPYAALFEHKANKGLKVRDRARHHIYEIIRVLRATDSLNFAFKFQEKSDPNACFEEMRIVGRLINETHESLRDQYDLSTKKLEAVRNIALDQWGVLGSRLMGGGFGGSVLALVKEEYVNDVISAAQKEFYSLHPELNGKIGKGILVNTPGEGVSRVDLFTRLLTSDMYSQHAAALALTSSI